jgi:hypothetical protein
MNDVTKTKDPALTAIMAKAQKRHDKAPAVFVKMKGKEVSIEVGKSGDPDDLLRLMAAMGTSDSDFLNAFLGQIGNSVSRVNEITEDSMRFALGVIIGVEPKDEIEAMLAAQMAAVHVCALESSRRYLWAGTLTGKDSAERALTKLTRTFATQMETLKRYRSKGQQVVRVERVTVHEGGKAIVGPVQHGGRGVDEEK